MSALDLNLDNRSFDDLVEAARSRLPALAPGWTDYNLHDPGITLVELVAWLGEAQIYSLARMRRDERLAYAAYAGIAPAGPRSARGLIWPDPADPASALNACVRPFAITAADAIRPVDADRPLCRVLWPTLLVSGRTTALTSLLASGVRIEHGASNARGQVAYAPFGPEAGPRDVLRIDVLCTSPSGLAERASADLGARLSLGLRVDGVAPIADPLDVASATPSTTLEVTLIIGSTRHRLAVVSDSSAGWSRSGVLGLSLPAQLPAAPGFSLELRAPRGFACPPRVRQIALNVLAVEQSVVTEAELHVANGQVDQLVELNDATLRGNGGMGVLRVDGGAAPPRLEIEHGVQREAWRAVRRFDAAGPDDPVYVLDAEQASLQFGNGINGRVPPQGAQLRANYSTCDGAAGNQPRPRAWFASGFGPIGRNLDPIDRGSDAQTLQQARGAARRAVRERHALVTADDIAAAALAQSALQVARVLVLPFVRGVDVPGTITLIALRRRTPKALANGALETEPARWLEALRAALQPRLPLAQTLVLRAPAYAGFALQATLQAAPLLDVSTIKAVAMKMLAQRLNPIADAPGDTERSLGLALNGVDLGAWLRRVDGVRAVSALTLRDAAGRVVDAIEVGPIGLPRFDAATVMIDVVRPNARSSA